MNHKYLLIGILFLQGVLLGAARVVTQDTREVVMLIAYYPGFKRLAFFNKVDHSYTAYDLYSNGEYIKIPNPSGMFFAMRQMQPVSQASASKQCPGDAKR